MEAFQVDNWILPAPTLAQVLDDGDKPGHGGVQTAEEREVTNGFEGDRLGGVPMLSKEHIPESSLVSRFTGGCGVCHFVCVGPDHGAADLNGDLLMREVANIQ